jgi:ABC-type enterochelin transport system permease subunit
LNGLLNEQNDRKMPDKNKFQEILGYVYAIIFGIAIVVVFDYFWMKVKSEHLPVLLSIAAGLIGFIVKAFYNSMKSEIDKKMDKNEFNAYRGEFIDYREADKNIHTEILAIMDHIKSTIDEVQKNIHELRKEK